MTHELFFLQLSISFVCVRGYGEKNKSFLPRAIWFFLWKFERLYHGKKCGTRKKDRPYICIWTGHMEWADLVLDMEKREAEDSFWTRGGPSQRRCVRPHTVRRLPSTVKRTSKSAYGMPYIRSGWCWYAGRGSWANTARSASRWAGGIWFSSFGGKETSRIPLFCCRAKPLLASG